jgi:hypothetical protein
MKPPRPGLDVVLALWLALGCSPAATDPLDEPAAAGDGGSHGGASRGGAGGAGRGGGDAAGGRPIADGSAPATDGPLEIRDGGGASDGAPHATNTANGDAQAAGAAIPPGTPLALPMVVTDNYENRGWFGDADMVSRFAGSGIIREVAGGGGPCATRPPGARGTCMQFTYTPPPGLDPPVTGGWVGDFFLRTLAGYHPEASPTPRPGQANWGYEPAVALAPGATGISFYAAADRADARVTFRAGIDRDSFVAPELTPALTPAWQKFTLPLGGVAYGWNVFGPFGWMIRDTTKPATFYLDGVVWEGNAAPPRPPVVITPVPVPPSVPAPGPGPTPPAAPAGQRDGVRQMVFINQCRETVWVGAYGNPVPEGGGFRLDAGQRRTIVAPAGKWTGRFWGRTGCTFDAAGAGDCETGSCGPREKCAGATGEPPATLVEFTLGAGGADPDFYDVSLVDGYNLPMAVAPLPGTFTRRGSTGNDCGAPTCSGALATSCPAELRFTNAGAKVVACLSACERFRTEEYCCSGSHDSPGTCPAFAYSKIVKAACPSAYSYAYDDATSTFTCAGEDYGIWFCP